MVFDICFHNTGTDTLICIWKVEENHADGAFVIGEEIGRASFPGRGAATAQSSYAEGDKTTEGTEVVVVCISFEKKDLPTNWFTLMLMLSIWGLPNATISEDNTSRYASKQQFGCLQSDRWSMFTEDHRFDSLCFQTAEHVASWFQTAEHVAPWNFLEPQCSSFSEGPTNTRILLARLLLGEGAWPGSRTNRCSLCRECCPTMWLWLFGTNLCISGLIGVKT